MRRGRSKIGAWLAFAVGVFLPSYLWLLAMSASSYSGEVMFALAVAQIILTVIALTFLLSPVYGNRQHIGPVVTQFLALHFLIYYGITNVVPALLPELRPQEIAAIISVRIPPASPVFYLYATIAATILAMGLLTGSMLANKLFLPRKRIALVKSRKYAWLPDFNVSLTSTLVLLIAILIGTLRFGAGFGTVLTSESTASFGMLDKLLFNGLLPFLPIAPLLASSAYIQATTTLQRRKAFRWMIGTVLLVVVSMLIWRMRTYAMMSIALPVLLLLYVGAIPWCRTVLPAVLLIALAYFGITGARINLEKSTEWQSGQIDITEFGNALTTIDWQAVTSKTMGDVSYRTAGLEGVASIIRAQELGWADTQQGKVLGAGFLQSLPLFLRPEFEIPERVKTAPSFLGIFLPGDWVTTFLAEFVLDYGIYALIVPGFFVGILIGLVDSGLLSLGIRPGLQGLLILRFPFLLYPVVFGTTVSDMIVTMFKGTLGFAVIFVVVSLWLSARSQLQRRNSHRHKETDVLVTRVLNV